MSTQKTLDDLIQCLGCDGYFEPEKTIRSGDEDFCDNCHEGFCTEIRNTGIKHLDEYLESRKLGKDFNVFAQSKFSGITEEEYNELNPD